MTPLTNVKAQNSKYPWGGHHSQGNIITGVITRPPVSFANPVAAKAARRKSLESITVGVFTLDLSTTSNATI